MYSFSLGVGYHCLVDFIILWQVMEETISILVGLEADVLKFSRARKKEKRIHYELT